jgi:hypothetical protein
MRAICCRRFAAHERASTTICRLTPAATCFRRFATMETWVMPTVGSTGATRQYRASLTICGRLRTQVTRDFPCVLVLFRGYLLPSPAFRHAKSAMSPMAGVAHRWTQINADLIDREGICVHLRDLRARFHPAPMKSPIGALKLGISWVRSVSFSAIVAPSSISAGISFLNR